MIGTLFNILLYIGLQKFIYCLIRQIFVCIFCVIHFYFKDKVRLVNEELINLEDIMIGHSSILKYQKYLYFLLLFLLVGKVYCENPPYFGASYLDLFLWISVFLYMALLIWKLMLIVSTPSIRILFHNPKKKLGFRYFATSTKIIYICKLCASTLFGGGLTIWVGPKFMSGFDHDLRGNLFSELAEPFVGYKCKSEWVSRRVNRLLIYKPNILDSLKGEDGFIDPFKVDEAFKKYEIPVPGGFLETEHKVVVSPYIPQLSTFKKTISDWFKGK
jgi:hypothetical protein